MTERDPLNAEMDLLLELAAAAEDLDKIAAALIRTGDMRIVATDIGAAAIAERATRLTKAVSALKRFRDAGASVGPKGLRGER